MLKLVSLYSLIFAFVASSSHAQVDLVPEWRFIANGSFSEPVLNGLSKGSPKFIGVVSSESGLDSSNRVHLSDDGGLTWRVALKDRNLNLNENMLPGEGDWITRWYHSIARPTKDLVLVLASDRPKDDPDQGFFGSLLPYLLRSDDAGATWTRIPIILNPKPWGLNWLTMADPATGYLVSNSPNSNPGNVTTIYKTIDAGKSWQPLSVSFNIETIRCFDALSNRELVIVTDDQVHITTDAGKSWKHNDPAPNAVSYSFNSVEKGFAIGGSMTGNGVQSTVEAYRTTNGGETWQPLLDTLLSGSTGDEIAFSDELNGALLSRGVILHTTNGGASWYQVSGPYELIEQTGQDLVFTSDTTAVALFQNQVVVLTGQRILKAPSPQLIQTTPLSYLAEWSPITGATSYRIQLAEKPADGLIVYDLGIFETNKTILDTVITTPMLALPAMKYSKDYFIRTQAIGKDVHSAWSSQLIRRTPDKPNGTGLASPVLTSPSHDTVIAASQVLLRWQGDATTTNYSVKLTKYGNFAGAWADSIANNTYGVTADSLVVSLDPNKTYNWFVIAHSSEGDSIASTSYRTFHTTMLAVKETEKLMDSRLSVRSTVATDFFEITGHFGNIKLIDILGNVVKSVDVVGSPVRMYIGDLPIGAYFMVSERNSPVSVQVIR